MAIDLRDSADVLRLGVADFGEASVKLFRRGAGRPLLFLHGFDGPRSASPFADRLAGHMDVFAPVHPGFDRTELPGWIDHIDDLVYLYLDLMDRLDLLDVTLVGLDMGGWIAAEIAVRNTGRLARLVLAGAVGIKAGGREDRDIPDIWGLFPAQVRDILWSKPENAPDFSALEDAELETIGLNQEAAALYLWEPYMHNPRLRRRLHRIDVPALYLRGAKDGLISERYAQAYVADIPGARLETIADAAHFVEIEQPAKLADAILKFAGAI